MIFVVDLCCRENRRGRRKLRVIYKKIIVMG